MSAVEGQRSDVVPRLLHGALALVVAASFAIQLTLLFAGGADANTGDNQDAVPVPVRLLRMLSYFTIQSNVFVLGASLALCLDPRREGPLWRVLRLDALLGITITGLVYWTLLAPLVDLHGVALAAGMGFHLVSPVGSVVLWLVFGPRPRVSWSTVRWAFVWPLAWIAYTFVHGAITGWYPYPFLDAGELGYPRALLGTSGVVVLGVLLLLLFHWLDRKLPAAPR